MHRRASAAAHLADRIPEQSSPDTHADAADDVVGGGAQPAWARPRGGFGRRHLSRRARTGDDGGGRWFASWHLPALPSLRRPSTTRTSAPPSAAARRRRILSVLAAATLLTALVVGVAALVGISLPAWLVAVPGGLMVGYLVLLAVVRPGARRQARPAVPLEDTDPAVHAGQAPSSKPQIHVLTASQSAAVSARDADDEAVVLPKSEAVDGSRWTPVPLPAPTYVTAPKARRSVRVIDLSNPGSWTAGPAAPEPPRADLPGDPVSALEDEDYAIEHRRAVGD